MSEFNENLRPDEQLEPNAAPADSPAVQPEPAFQPEPVVESAAETPQEFPFTPPAIPQFIPDAPIKTKKVRAKKAGNTKSRAFSGKLIAMILCLSLLGGLIGGAISGSMLFLFSDQDDDDDDRKSIFENDKDTIKGEPNNGEDITTVVPEGQRDKVTIEKQPIDTSELKSVQQVYADNVDSIVGISTNYVTENWWGGKQEGGSAGSGVVYSADGYILTNHHVIEKAETITVHFHDGTSKPATLLGYDVNNDIAVLKAEATDLQPAIWGDSEKLIVGDTVLAIGNPLGELTFALTTGVVSTPPRDVTMSQDLTMSLIQTDCAINSGNSGGGLFNLYGELVGITNAKYSTNGLTQATIDNIGFAIPISDVKHIIEGIITKGEFERPYIGVSVTNATENSETKEPAGAKIDSVEKDLAADKAGIKKGDIITKFGDYDVKNINDLRGAVKKYQKGDKITVTLYRNGKHLTIELVMTVLVQPALPQA